MTNIAAPAVHPTASRKAVGNPGKTGKTAAAKSDFRQHLAIARTAARSGANLTKNTPTTAAEEAVSFAETAAEGANSTTPGTAQALLPFLATTPHSGVPATIKTAKPAKKEIAIRLQTRKAIAPQNTLPAAPASATAPPPPQATLPSPPGDVLPPIAQTAPQTRADAGRTLKQTAQAGTPVKTAIRSSTPGEAAPTAIAPQVAQNGDVPASSAASHKAATSGAADASGIAAQLADALRQTIAKPGGVLALHLALKPETLGAVSIKIQPDHAGDANVIITASQPETLAALKKDVANLNQILTNAGVPEAGRQIDFRAAPVAAAQSNAGLGNAANPSMQGNSGRQQSPQNGTGFAYASYGSAAVSALASPAAAPPAAPQSAAGSVDMIA